VPASPLQLLFIRSLAERSRQFLKFDRLLEMPHGGRSKHVRCIAVAHLPSYLKTDCGLAAMITSRCHSGVSQGRFLFFLTWVSKPLLKSAPMPRSKETLGEVLVASRLLRPRW
jgi:hypothetical protein